MKTPTKQPVTTSADSYGFTYRTNNIMTDANHAHPNQQLKNSTNRLVNTPRASHKIYTRDSSALKRSSAKSESNTVRNGNTLSGSNFKERIEKLCPTFNQSDLRKEIVILKKQIQKMEKEAIRKDQQLKEMKATLMPSNQAQAELLEVYRSLHYYQGKTKQMEDQLYRFRELISNSTNGAISQESINLIFEELRRDNEELHAALEETEFMRNSLQSKYNKLESKYFQIQRELAEMKRKQANPLAHLDPVLTQALSTQHLNRTVNEMLTKNKVIPQSLNMELKQKQILFREAENQLNIKIEKMRDQLYENRNHLERIAQELDEVKAQNSLLRSQSEDKDRQIQDLFKQYASARKSIRELESGREPSHYGRSQRAFLSAQKI